MRAIHTQSTSNEWGLETWCSEIFLFTDNREEGFSALKGFLVFPTGNLLIVLALIWVYTLYCPSTKHQTAEGSSQDFAGQILSRLDTLGIIKRRLFHQSSDSRQTRKACNCSDHCSDHLSLYEQSLCCQIRRQDWFFVSWNLIKKLYLTKLPCHGSQMLQDTHLIPSATVWTLKPSASAGSLTVAISSFSFLLISCSSISICFLLSTTLTRKHCLISTIN